SFLERFHNEVRIARQVTHADVCRVYDIGEVGQQHFLTMEYVEGSDLTTLRWPAARSRFDDLVVQCLRALDYIHSRGLLHNDIKPQNILVRPPFLVKVLDFGLAQQQADARRVAPGGTIHYIAPERFKGGRPDGRSDLYSLGVVLYQMLTGVLPFEGRDPGRVISAILAGSPRLLRSLNPEIPERMESFVLALLARDPADRPASTIEALALLDAGGVGAHALDTPETYASFVTSGRFVGRDAELETLVDLATAHTHRPTADDGQARLVLVSGASGIGKSRLLRELKHRLQLAGIRNLTGRCYEDGGAPFQPFAEVMRQLPPPGDAELPTDLRPILGQLLPTGGVRTDRAPGTEESLSDGVAAGRASPPASAAPTVAALLGKDEFIARLAAGLDFLAGGVPGVLVLEDLHWGQAPEIDLLEHLVLRPARTPWLLIGSLRDEEARGAPAGLLLKRLGASARLRRIDLEPLDAEQATELLASMVPFGERPERLASLLVERTDGNPLYLEELMKALAEEGTLRRSGGAWIAESRTLDAIHLPPSLAGVVARRLAALAAGERALLEALSVFNRPVPVPLLARVLGLDPQEATAWIEALERLRMALVETRRSGPPLVDLAHARIRDAAYQELSEERRRALHLAVGSAIETASSASLDDVVEELAHHFYVAGDRERAVTYSLRAAERAESLFNARRQVEFLKRALDLMPPEDAARRMRALHALALNTVVDLGEREKGRDYALQLFEEARRAGDQVHEARALRIQGWATSYLEDLDGATELGKKALVSARAAGNRKEIASSLSYLGTMRARQGDHLKALDTFREATEILESLGDLQGLVTTLNNIAICHLGVGEAETARTLLDRLLQIAKENGLTYHYYRYLSNLGPAILETGDVPGAIRVIEQALAWSRDHTSTEQAGHQLSHLGPLYAHRGRFDRAVQLLEEERSLLAEMGDRAGQIQSLDFLGTTRRDLGRPDLALEHHREGLDLARRLNARMQEGYLTASLAADRLASGEVGPAEDLANEALAIGRELTHPRITFCALCVIAQAAMRRHDRKGVLIASRNLTRQDPRLLRFKDRLQANLVLGRCALEVGKIADAEREAQVGLQSAEKGGFRELQWRFQAFLGEIFTARGLPDDAAHAYNAAHVLIGQVASEIEDPAVRDDYEKDQQKQEIARQVAGTAPAPLRLGGVAPEAGRDAPLKMLATMYEITQIINSILDLKELLSKVMDLAIDIVGAERGLVFLYRSETDEMEMVIARNMEHQTIEDATAYSRNIIRQAGLGRPILTHDAVADSRFKEFRSVTMYQIRSLLCVPLKIRNRVIGTVYVDTRAPGTVFSEDDLRFLEAFANQAAIAIENARLYDQVRQENQYLKQAVQERYGYESLVGRSARMRSVFAMLSRVSASTLPVMIRGESGTGKELVARAIHHNSPRRDQKFFSENCAALTETLLESELFGHAKGAFTGADAPRRGLFEMADGGTLFLDEIGDMSLGLQSKLLRVLQEGEIRPVGSETSRKVDVRVVSATNRDLEAMIKERKFREDLYFRLKVISVTLPALRERREDIPLLVDHFLGRVAQENKSPKLRLEPVLMSVLTRYDWPGNVRELENQVYKLALFAAGDTITLDDARHDVEFYSKLNVPGARGVDTGVTREEIDRALGEAKGNRDEAARLLGISRAT
ncbi:MAG TPA: sigma 54-interacting transcriptional regulator, partial [Candidatus Polarisedimenticolia bacterium]|nr:sigma 54-interacting transcriptional regulator [Candidatus Polarisedimenticolia bacterium]